MKIKDTHKDQAIFFAVVFVTISLFISVRISSISIIALGAIWLLSGKFKNSCRLLKSDVFSQISLLFYGLHIIGLAYTHNIQAGTFALEKKLSFVIFPLILGTISIERRKTYQILLTFTVCCFLCCVYGLGMASLLMYLKGDSKYFFLQAINNIINFHRVYFSLYLLFSIIILLYLWYYKIFYSTFFKIYSFLSIPLFTLFIILSGSRMIIVDYFFCMVVFCLYLIIKKRKFLQAIAISIVFSIVMIFVILNTPKTKNLVKDLFTNLNRGGETVQTGPSLRVSIWKNSIEVIKENMFIGVGTGDAVDELKIKYIENNFTWGIIWAYNAHNDYLQTTLCFGLIGLVIFLTLLGKPMLESIKQRKFLLVALILMFGFAMLSESFLENQKGIVFFCLIYNLLIYHYLPKTVEEPIQ